MPCLGPLTAYYSKDVNPSGKRSLVFKKQESLSGVPVFVRCGQCIECRLSDARVWAIRLMKEARMHEVSSFITLTYDNEHLPQGNTLVKRDIALFCKRLHNRLLRDRGHGIRFYYSGEYGETFGRPHYHAIIFGYNFPDKKFYKRNARGENIYVSDFLRELWPFGRNGIGEVTFDSCAYTAGYVVEKVNGKKREEGHYLRVDEDGVVFELQPEFSGMSRRPGIGATWFKRYGAETYRDDSMVVDGRAVRPPRYFDNLFEEVDSVRLKRLKSVRARRAKLFARGKTSRHSYAREKILRAKLALRRKDVT